MLGLLLHPERGGELSFDKTNVTIAVDQDKVHEDPERAKEKIQHIGQAVKEKVAASTSNGKSERARPRANRGNGGKTTWRHRRASK